MHCGLTNATAPFQRFMSEGFKDILDVCVVVYLDDILIYSDNPDEHLKHVYEVLRRLRASTLYTKVEKCAFIVDTTDCLGFVIGLDGLRSAETWITIASCGCDSELILVLVTDLIFSSYCRSRG